MRRWRPPLTLNSSVAVWSSQLCVDPIRSGFLVLGFGFFFHCINRGFFSSIGMDFCVEKLCPNSVNACCFMQPWNKFKALEAHMVC